jgi:drug/metabolite transporter (DMT)-like permease
LTTDFQGSVPASNWAIIAYLGVFQVGFAYWMMVRAVRWLSALQVSLILLLEPLASPFWAFLFQAERPTRWTLAGGGVALVATASSVLAARRAPDSDSSARALRG